MHVLQDTLWETSKNGTGSEGIPFSLEIQRHSIGACPVLRARLWAVMLLVFSPLTGWGDEQATLQKDRESIEPQDVFVHVGMVREELERIRFVMGRPENEQPEIAVNGAAPREVYFQAISMFQKANRLCFEHTRERVNQPKLPTGEIVPADVYHIVEAALQRLRRVKQKLNITVKSTAIERDDSKTPTDVFRSCVQASRQLNLLLERRFAPSDVFQQVTFAVGYTARLLEHFPDATVIPDSSRFEEGKRSRDVYLRLVGCFDRIRSIAGQSGLKILELETKGSRAAAALAEPSDVYDIASLIVSELAYLHANLKDTKDPRPVFFVGRKFPSHVYQRAGILEEQLIELEAATQKSPNWLNQRGGQ